MAAAENEVAGSSDSPEILTQLPFPPVTKTHILNCSYHNWYPLYRSVTPKARLIPLTAPFLSYLRADGIILPPEDPQARDDDEDSGIFSSDSSTVSDDQEDPSTQFPEVHARINEVIDELGGRVVPKLNWSSPKDATWIAATNSMECQSANEIYLLLKSSDFITHDLEHVFDDVEDEDPAETASKAPAPPPKTIDDIPYHLILRKHVQMNPSVEFRCFVRQRTLVAICQRDLNHFDFLFPMIPALRSRIQSFFVDHLKNTFPDDNFVFDVYIPPPHERVWLIDINPWAMRTDPLLFSWLEILTMNTNVSNDHAEDYASVSSDGSKDTGSLENEVEEVPFVPEFRLVKKDDPEAYSFNTPQYSAHKMPKDVVDASRGGPGAMREFAEHWKEILAQAQQEDSRAGDDSD
ncbi:D123-domain-containing protein [Xylona heveae TC161]|uniref:D123-domain-containing protein n=1 Tax=Xylona heveae (strain CBS 132557 / TC161) TaxID=1328760 RepID=A0A165FTE8_XYLHT|nr:D123-domain-containing protein [Xylona heveae TC161]KZF21354.1 D123-domain-containing protein [Xylona heveae TC161]